jgi:hypothetical protein
MNASKITKHITVFLTFVKVVHAQFFFREKEREWENSREGKEVGGERERELN